MKIRKTTEASTSKPEKSSLNNKMMKPKTRCRLRWESEVENRNSAGVNHSGSPSGGNLMEVMEPIGESSGGKDDFSNLILLADVSIQSQAVGFQGIGHMYGEIASNEAILASTTSRVAKRSTGGPPTFQSNEDTKKCYKGINFYKRIGFWAANIWDTTFPEPKQVSLGSWPTVTEAARAVIDVHSAYDRASLKVYGKAINHDISHYGTDISKMADQEKMEYFLQIRLDAESSKPTLVGEGVTACPRGWYEVKKRDKTPARNWEFLGRFRNLEEALRFSDFSQMPPL